MILFVFAGVLGALGLFVIICPKQATKKENRNNEAAVKKVRMTGVLYIIIGVILLALALPTTLKKEVKCTMCGKTMEVSLFSNAEKNFCDRCMGFFEDLFGE